MCLYLEKAVHQLIISTCSFYTILIGILWWKSPQACISLYLRDNAICLISPNHISNDLLLMKTHTMMKIPPGLHFFLSASQRHLPNLSQASQWDHLHTKVGTVCSLFFYHCCSCCSVVLSSHHVGSLLKISNTRKTTIFPTLLWTVFSNLVLKRLLDKLPVTCPNADSCKETSQRGILEDHLKYR